MTGCIGWVVVYGAHADEQDTARRMASERERRAPSYRDRGRESAGPVRITMCTGTVETQLWERDTGGYYVFLCAAAL